MIFITHRRILGILTFGASAAMIMTGVVGCSGASTPPVPSEEGKTSTDKLPTDKGSESASGGSTTSTSTPPSEKKSESATNAVCVEKDAKANDKGIGAYCDADTRCKIGFLCTGDFGAPEGSTFCTTVCMSDDDCGAGAHCFAEERGRGCVLDACQAQ